MRLPPGLVRARLLRRLNRFAVLVDLDGRPVEAHLPNSGRLHELLTEGNVVHLAPAPRPGRKTAWDLALVETDGVAVSADARLPSRLFHEAVEDGRLAEFRGYRAVRREVALGRSRLDLELAGPQGSCYVEVKSVTLVEAGVGLFPDAPTERGRRHVRELAQAVGQGYEAAVVFVIQRPDASAFSPHPEADPEFRRALAEARGSGVRVIAYRCHVDLREVRIEAPVEVRLG